MNKFTLMLMQSKVNQPSVDSMHLCFKDICNSLGFSLLVGRSRTSNVTCLVHSLYGFGGPCCEHCQVFTICLRSCKLRRLPLIATCFHLIFFQIVTEKSTAQSNSVHGSNKKIYMSKSTCMLACKQIIFWTYCLRHTRYSLMFLIVSACNRSEKYLLQLHTVSPKTTNMTQKAGDVVL